MLHTVTKVQVAPKAIFRQLDLKFLLSLVSSTRFISCLVISLLFFGFRRNHMVRLFTENLLRILDRTHIICDFKDAFPSAFSVSLIHDTPCILALILKLLHLLLQQGKSSFIVCHTTWRLGQLLWAISVLLIFI